MLAVLAVAIFAERFYAKHSQHGRTQHDQIKSPFGDHVECHGATAFPVYCNVK